MNEKQPDRCDREREPAALSAGLPVWKRLWIGKAPRNWRAAVAAGGVLLLFGAVWTSLGEMRPSDEPLLFARITRGELPITVLELGTLESQVETTIRCELDDVTGDGRRGAVILYLAPNGSELKQGELLVEFDSAPLRELRLDRYALELLKARAEQIQATAKYENQKTQNETLRDEAKLKVELAKLDLMMYEDGTDGTYQITRKELGLVIQEAKSQIAEAQAALAMQITDRKGIALLHRLGYRGKGDLEQATYRYLRAEDRVVTATNSLAKARSDLRKLEEYEYKMQLKMLKGALETAQRGLLQVEIDNQSLLAQAEAVKIASDKALTQVEAMLQEYQDQLEKCKVYAPHAGIVVYTPGNDWDEQIHEGAVVRERQRILSLPVLSSMQVNTDVHESVLDQIRVGLPATIRIDAYPDRTYHGDVDSVEVLPDRRERYRSDVNVYETIVKIDGKVQGLKPGMTAVVEIHVEQLRDVLRVPLPAVVEIERENWCYVHSPNGLERRRVTIGKANARFAQVLDGLQEGQRVVLNPMGLVDAASERKRTISPEASIP